VEVASVLHGAIDDLVLGVDLIAHARFFFTLAGLAVDPAGQILPVEDRGESLFLLLRDQERGDGDEHEAHGFPPIKIGGSAYLLRREAANGFPTGSPRRGPASSTADGA